MGKTKGACSQVTAGDVCCSLGPRAPGVLGV